MAAIPPNWLTSIVGSQGAQHQSGTQKAKEDSEQADRTGSTRFTDSLQNVIENTDKDGEVYTDSEGLGSQGRAPSEESEEEAQADQPDTDQPAGGLDIEA